MKRMRKTTWMAWMGIMMLPCVTSAAAEDRVSPDHAIMQQAADAMVFQIVYADIILATGENENVVALAQHIHDLSKHGLQSIEDMAQKCGFSVDASLDATAWRRVRALREISVAELREQVYLDAQLMRLYEARQEALHASQVAKHEIVKGFAMRSEPEIETLILTVLDVVNNRPT